MTARVQSKIVLSLALLAALAVAGAAPAQPPSGGGAPPAPVETAQVLEQEVRVEIPLVGTAEPSLESVIASEGEGLVLRVEVEEGDAVISGQLLCEQDSSQVRLRIEAARAALAEAEVLRVQAEREWERQKRLFAIQSVSEKAYENARFEVEALGKKVERLRTERLVLEDQQRKKKIRAPLAGTVIRRHAQQGQWLGEGQPVVTLVVLDPVRVMVPVPERHIAAVRTGSGARVVFDALRGETFEGLVTAVIPSADPGARAFPVRIEIPNPGGRIRGGMLGRVSLPVGDPYRALLVPRDALVLGGPEPFVYVVNERHARQVTVRPGRGHRGLIEVQGDLKPGMEVVVRGNERLRPGQPVRRPGG